MPLSKAKKIEYQVYLEKLSLNGKKTVYFVVDFEANAVKIGISRDPHQRLNTLREGNPHILEMVGAIKGANEQVELALQRRFEGDRLHGEWFNLSEELGDFIDLLHCPDYDPVQPGLHFEHCPFVDPMLRVCAT